jgi:predicted MFS family arabinose efflux permease
MDAAWQAASTQPGEFNLSGGRARAFAALFMGLVALSNVGLALVPVVAPALQDRFAFSDAQVGLLNSIFALAVGLAAIPTGLITARWGGRVVFLAAGLYVAGCIVFALGGSYGWFIVGRCIQGLGAGATLPAGTALITRYVAADARPFAFGLFGAGMGVGTTAGLLLMPSIAKAWGYQGVFLTAAALAACLAAIGATMPVIRRRPPGGGSDSTTLGLVRTLGKAARTPRVWLVGLLCLTPGSAVVGILTWTPQFLHDTYGAALAVAAYVTAGVGVALIVGNPVGAVVMQRLGLGASMALALAGMAVAVALVPFSPGIAAACAAVLIAAVLAGAVLPPSLTAIGYISSGPDSLGAAVGIIGIANAAGAMVAPWAFGALLDAYGTAPDQTGYTAGYLMLAAYGVVGMVAALVFALLQRTGRLRPGSARLPGGGRPAAGAEAGTASPPRP